MRRQLETHGVVCHGYVKLEAEHHVLFHGEGRFGIVTAFALAAVGGGPCALIVAKCAYAEVTGHEDYLCRYCAGGVVVEQCALVVVDVHGEVVIHSTSDHDWSSGTREFQLQGGCCGRRDVSLLLARCQEGDTHYYI